MVTLVRGELVEIQALIDILADLELNEVSAVVRVSDVNGAVLGFIRDGELTVGEDEEWL